jgi:hypothetical protein
MEIIELSHNQCFICRDSCNTLYKICDCNDSTICDECYELESTQQMTQCGICRKKYVFDVERNYWDILKILFKHTTKYGVILCIELFCPIFLYIQADYSELNNVFLIYTFFCITIGNILIWYLTERLIHNEESAKSFMLIYTPLKCIYIMLIFIIIQYINDIHKLKLYAYYILLFIYTMPMLFFSCVIFGRKGIKYKKYIDDITISKKINVKAILNNSHSEV